VKEYMILRLSRGKEGKTEDDVEQGICAELNQLAEKGWRVIQDLNHRPYCHKFLLEREINKE